jgi:Cu(I)/Ag(I) efflux system periplasmic protein CusF
MNAISTLTLAVILALSSTSFALAGTAQPASSSAQTEGSSGAHQATTSGQAAETAASMSEGEIKKVDKEAGKITIKHGPLTNLDMPAMTMVFRVKDPAMLDQVMPGDKVKFVADKVAGTFTVIQLENAR